MLECLYLKFKAKEGVSMDRLQTQITDALDRIRPALQKDGGDVEFIAVNDDMVVSVRLTGACSACPMSDVTLKEGIEKFLKSEVPAVKAVEAVT